MAFKLQDASLLFSIIRICKVDGYQLALALYMRPHGKFSWWPATTFNRLGSRNVTRNRCHIFTSKDTTYKRNAESIWQARGSLTNPCSVLQPKTLLTRLSYRAPCPHKQKSSEMPRCEDSKRLFELVTIAIETSIQIAGNLNVQLSIVQWFRDEGNLHYLALTEAAGKNRTCTHFQTTSNNHQNHQTHHTKLDSLKSARKPFVFDNPLSVISPKGSANDTSKLRVKFTTVGATSYLLMSR